MNRRIVVCRVGFTSTVTGAIMKSLFSGTVVAGLLLSASMLVSAAEMPQTASPEGAEVYIISPNDGETVTSPFKVQFGLKGMGVAPAGVDVPETGHHHLLIDVKDQPAANMPLPVSDNIRHFGKGQTETELNLPPGQHTLQLLMGDKGHMPLNPSVESKKVTINVK
ncbi:ATPase of the AAA+ [Pseudomonas syringae pv. tomato]|nr:ATPase of the AAA+ [Pseudomonas syringae pv. tomato]